MASSHDNISTPGSTRQDTLKLLGPGAHSKPSPSHVKVARIIVFALLNFSIVLCICSVSIPSLVLCLHSHSLYRSFIRLIQKSFASHIAILVYLVCPGTELVLTGDHALMKAKSKAVVICNHQVGKFLLLFDSLFRCTLVCVLD